MWDAVPRIFTSCPLDWSIRDNGFGGDDVHLVAITTPHALVLTVSHGLLFRQPRYMRRRRCRRFCSPLSFTDSHSNLHRIDRAPPTLRVTSRALSKAALTGGFARDVAGLSSCARLLVAMRAEPMKLLGPNFRALPFGLNLAIPYAVQSGFCYPASLICLACATDLLEPTSWSYAPGVQGNAAPSSRADSVTAS